MKKLLYLLVIIPLIALSCKKEPKVEAATFIINNEEITIGTTTAVLTVTFSYPGNLARIDGLVSKNSDMSNALVSHAAVNQNVFVVKFMGLQPNTQYYYQYEYSTGTEVNTTNIGIFQTNDYAVPTVTTAEITDIDATSAKCGGEVIDEGGLEVTARGVCWSMSHNPTTNDPHTTEGSGVGTFTSLITVTGIQTYYVRAYAVNSKGTGYGEERSFEVYIPQSGLFSVSETKKVRFSLGNLQYQASTNTWRFAEHPWDFVGGIYNGNEYGNVYENGVKCDNSLIDSLYTGWIDLFAWGTSGYNHGAVCYQPWSTGGSSQYDYNAYGNATFDLNVMSGQADWGYNPISNGGNEENQWRTLTYDEFFYVLQRHNSEGTLYYCYPAYVNGVDGTILLPDNWNHSLYTLNKDSMSSNMVSASDWVNIFEENGAVFLPWAGHRDATNYSNYSGGHYYGSSAHGVYWTSSHYSSLGFACVAYSYFFNIRIDNGAESGKRRGFSVRLVRDVE